MKKKNRVRKMRGIIRKLKSDTVKERKRADGKRGKMS